MQSDIFDQHYQNNYWGDPDSVSGPGSNLKQTENIRRELPTLFAQLGIKSVLDAACGDYFWWKEMDLPGIDYKGIDIVPELIEANKKFEDEFHYFDWYDAGGVYPIGNRDLIFCRDLLVHLSWAEANFVLKNFRASGSKWLLATTFPGAQDMDITTGMWRPIDMARFRYMARPPELLIPDGDWGNKSLGLWRLL